MEIVAKTTKGFLIEATKDEVDEILNSVLGQPKDNIDIGQKIPAIDYASSIRKIQALSKSYHYKELMTSVSRFTKFMDELKENISEAENISV